MERPSPLMLLDLMALLNKVIIRRLNSTVEDMNNTSLVVFLPLKTMYPPDFPRKRFWRFVRNGYGDVLGKKKRDNDSKKY